MRPSREEDTLEFRCQADLSCMSDFGLKKNIHLHSRFVGKEESHHERVREPDLRAVYQPISGTFKDREKIMVCGAEISALTSLSPVPNPLEDILMQS